ncbi:MAG: M35 family metallo-endopeptidase [Planctomycetota bacterium]
MAIRFDGFSARDEQRLVKAVDVLKRAAKNANDAMLAGDLTAFSKWFDSTGSNSHLMKVASIIKEVNDALTQRGITFADATGNSVDKSSGGLCGYVWMVRNDGPGDAFAGTIHAGSGMRVLMVPKTHDGNVNDLAETMYHELTHKVGGTDDLSYDVDVCLGYAKTNTQFAALNAENYNRFLGEFI